MEEQAAREVTAFGQHIADLLQRFPFVDKEGEQSTTEFFTHDEGFNLFVTTANHTWEIGIWDEPGGPDSVRASL